MRKTTTTSKIFDLSDLFSILVLRKERILSPKADSNRLEDRVEEVDLFKFSTHSTRLVTEYESVGISKLEEKSFILSLTTNMNYLNASNICNSSPCKNNGTCVSYVFMQKAMFNCICTKPFHGEYCQHEDICYSKPCGLNGLCYQLNETSYLCKCYIGYEGDRCQINLNEKIRQTALSLIEKNNLFSNFINKSAHNQLDLKRFDCPKSFCNMNGNCIRKLNNEKLVFNKTELNDLSKIFRCECFRNKTGLNCEIGLLICYF